MKWHRIKLRSAALQALAKQAASTRVARASHVHSHNHTPIDVGQFVFVVRKNAFNRVWREGPGVVIGRQGASLWVNINGTLYKVAAENCRLADSADLRGIEEINQLLPELRQQISSRQRVGRYQDLSREVVPATPIAIPATPGNAISRARRASQVSTEIPSEMGGTDGVHELALNAAMEPTSEVLQVQETEVEEVSAPEARGEEAEQNPGSTPEGDGAEVSMETDVGQGLVLAECEITALVKKGSDEVRWEQIPEKDRSMFLAAMEKEIKSMLEVDKAMTLLSASESQKVRQEHADRIIASRMHLRYKPVEGEDGKGLQYVAKA
eukprot:265467-Amphidinium_carterae.2